jgi:ribosomal protein S11
MNAPTWHVISGVRSGSPSVARVRAVSLRSELPAGIEVRTIRDATPIPGNNGCRPPK